MPAGDCLALRNMSEPEEPKAEENTGSGAHRSREDVLREIRLALALDGLMLPERRRQARGFDPYDSGLPGRDRDIWKGGRRG